MSTKRAKTCTTKEGEVVESIALRGERTETSNEQRAAEGATATLMKGSGFTYGMRTRTTSEVLGEMITWGKPEAVYRLLSKEDDES
jgi:hypothetical protein